MTYYWKIAKRLFGFHLYMDVDAKPNSAGVVVFNNRHLCCDMSKYVFGKLVKKRVEFHQVKMVAKYHKGKAEKLSKKAQLDLLEKNTSG